MAEQSKTAKIAGHIISIIIFFAICIYGIVQSATSTPADYGSVVLAIGAGLMGIVGLIAGATFKTKEGSGSTSGGSFKIKKAKATFEGFAPWAWIVIGILLVATVVLSSLIWSGTIVI